MWCIERIEREDSDNKHWEVIVKFPEWKLEDEAAALRYFVIMANTNQLDINKYHYNIAWN